MRRDHTTYLHALSCDAINRLFKEMYRQTLAHGHELLCKELCLVCIYIYIYHYIICIFYLFNFIRILTFIFRSSKWN